MPELSPDEVAAHAFSTSFRGLDPNEVRTFLARVADRLRAAEERAQELSVRVAEAEERAAHPEMDVDTLTSALGDETARILRSAQDAAADIRGKAEENVAQLLREAYEDAARIRGEAELVLAKETEAAEAAAAEIRAAAEADAAAALGRARQEAERLLADVESNARTMVEEAQASRTKILTDLARRRKLAHTQVEQLRAGRERLLEAYRLVRSTLDEVTGELVKAEGEARAAAEAAARRLSDEPVEGDALDIGAGDAEADEESPRETAPAGAPVEEHVDEPAPSSSSAAEPASESTAVVHAPTAEASKAAPPAEAPGPLKPPRDPRVAVAPPVPEPDERRLSSLRIIRRPRAEAEVEPASAPAPESRPETPAPEPPAAEPSSGFTPVAPASAGEAVRIIKPVRETPSASEPATPEPPLPEEAAEGTTPDGTEDTPEDAVPEAEPVVADEPPADATPDPPAGSVDDLFARIRADREQEVAKAREVLDQPAADDAGTGDGEPSEAEATPTDEAAEATEAVADSPVTDGDEALLQQRDRVVEDIEHRLARRLKRALQDEQNDVLDRFRSAKGKPAVDVVLPAADQHPERYRAVAAELLYEAARAGTAFVDDLHAEVSVDDLAESLAGDLAAPLRRRLERGFEEGADEDAPLLVERIGAAYRENKGKRIEQLAADHVIAAFSRGTFVATPEGSPLRWIVDDVGGPCPDCDDNALAGPTPRGEEYPTGRLHPPAHAGCRCLLAPASS
jgi:DivIVA domain-containing protein